MRVYFRRSMCFGCVAIAAAALLMAARAASSDEGPATSSDAAPAKRNFKFTYSVKIPVPADGSKLLEAWVPVPQTDDLQKVSDLKVEASVPHTVETESEYGNQMIHVRIENPKAEVSLSWSAVIERTADVGQGQGALHPRFTQPDKLVPLDGKAAQMATELGVKTGGTVRERAKKVYDNVLHTMFYDKVVEGWGKGDFDRACTVGKGNCTDFHAKFIGIARAAGIPVRFTMGVPLSGDPKGLAGGYHCWAHFYDGASWIPVDISEAQKLLEQNPAKAEWFFGNLDPDRVSLSVGRDVNLAPKQQGSALLFFIYPHVEVDAKKVDVPKEARTFSFENVGS